MPKLYFNHTEGGQWVVPGQQAKGSLASRVFVPNVPAELAAWLNERRVPLNAPQEGDWQLADEPHDWQLGNGRDGKNFTHDTPVGDPNRCSVCQTRLVATEEGALMLGRSADLDAFDLWLEGLDVTGLRALQRAAEAIRDRARALGLEWNERSVQ